MAKSSSSRPGVVKSTYIIFSALILAWIGAWMLKNSLDQRFDFVVTSGGSFLYWTTAKIIIWILPALWLLALSGRSIQGVINLCNWRGWLIWGCGIGLLLGLTGFIPNYLQGNPVLPMQFSFPLLNVLVIAPAFEEFLMRGAIMGNLQTTYTFFTANMITSLMFVVLHIPGWYFMGVLSATLTQPVGGALSVFLVSLAFGYAAQRSHSVMGGVLAHFLNNLF